MIQDSDYIKKAAARAKEEMNKEFQREQVRQQQSRDAETLSPDAGRDRTDIQAQIGRPLTRAEFMKRIQSLIPMAYYERANADPNKGGIYLKGRFLAGMEHGISPEFTVMEPTEAGHGQILMKGWRTILAQLIGYGYITVTEAENTFGILRGMESERWWTILN